MSVKLNVGNIFLEVDGDNTNISINTYNKHAIINENTNYVTNHASSRKNSLSINVGDSALVSLASSVKALLG